MLDTVAVPWKSQTKCEYAWKQAIQVLNKGMSGLWSVSMYVLRCSWNTCHTTMLLQAPNFRSAHIAFQYPTFTGIHRQQILVFNLSGKNSSQPVRWGLSWYIGWSLWIIECYASRVGWESSTLSSCSWLMPDCLVLSNSLRGCESSAMRGENFQSWFTMPRNLRSSRRFFGASKYQKERLRISNFFKDARYSVKFLH